MRDSEQGHNMRRIQKRNLFHHFIFSIILTCEVVICVVVFVGGVNFVLSQSTAGSIVSGILGIAFIVDIDNKGN